MSRLGRWRFQSVRWLVLSAGALLVAPAACGGNPELSLIGDSFHGGAQPGEPCEDNQDCAVGLRCGLEAVCVGACGTPSDTSCGNEACLVSGQCSEGLAESCKKDSDCNDGLVCSSFERCSVPCEAGARGVCKGGAHCRDEGTCATDKDIIIGLGGMGNEPDPGGAAGMPSCIDVDVTFQPQIPTVLLLLDRSGSMTANGGFGEAVEEAVAAGTYELGDCPSNNDWRWNVVRNVLFNADKGIVKPLEGSVRFGMSLYSSENGQVSENDPEAVDPDKMCPNLIEVPIALNNHQPMFDKYVCSDIKDDTPTGESLLAAAATLDAFDEPGPKVIVLATDGEPDNCECPDFGNTVPAACRVAGMPELIKDEVVATAKQIHDGDITIHVINVSTPSEAALQQHLTDLAEAGGGKVYPGFSPGDLVTAFQEIIDGVRSCVIELDGEIADGKESTGTVTLDGEELLLDDENGWKVNGPSEIELLGTACDAIKSGDHDLKIEFPCESFQPGPPH